MNKAPRLSIGLPVYQGEEYLSEALEALLGQTYDDFEIIISDNASTDGTADICRRFQEQDDRIRYLRQTHNIGAGPNHNLVFREARGELFKWASHDDLYARSLIERCVQALDEHPEAVLVHAGSGIIDPAGKLVNTYEYRILTDSPSAPERFRSLLHSCGGDDFYGVIRSDKLRRVKPHGSYHHADRTFVAEIALQGPFHQIPELLYFRRDHPTRAERAHPGIRSRCVNLDPRRANKFVHPTPRLYTDYVAGYLGAIRRAPISGADRRACYRHLAGWFTSRLRPGTSRRFEDEEPSMLPASEVSLSVIVAGRSGESR